MSTIHWLVDKLPPSTSDEDVESEFRMRVEDARRKGLVVGGDKEEMIVEEALERHRHNRKVHDFSVWALKD